MYVYIYILIIGTYIDTAALKRMTKGHILSEINQNGKWRDVLLFPLGPPLPEVSPSTQQLVATEPPLSECGPPGANWFKRR